MVTKYEWVDYRGVVWDLVDGPVALRSGVDGLGAAETLSFTRDFALLDGQGFTGWRGLPREVMLPVTIKDTASRAGWLAGLRLGKYGSFRVTSDQSGVRSLPMRFVGDVAASYEIDPFVMGYEMAGYKFVADSPWWDGPALSTTVQTPGDSLPFFAETTDRVFNIMSANSTGTATVSNPGEIDSWLTVQVDGPATAFSVGYNSGSNLAGSVTVNSGEYLLVDTNPTKQTAILYHVGSSEDVTDQLTAYSPIVIPPGATYAFNNIVLNGAGSMTVSLTPHFARAF